MAAKKNSTATNKHTAAKKRSPAEILRIVANQLARESYRASSQQKLIVKAMLDEGYGVAVTARTAKCTPKTVRLWKARDSIKCRVSPGRPRTARAPEVMEAAKTIAAKNKSTPMTHEAYRVKVVKATKVSMSTSSLARTKRELGVRGKAAMMKPERAFYKINLNKRVACAQKRLRWPVADVKRLVFLDESCGARNMNRIFQICTEADGSRERPIVPYADDKDEKVHFLVAIGCGKIFFFALAVRRAVVRDADGKAKTRKGRLRRKKGKTATQRAANAQKNKANCGQTWTASRLKRTVRKLLDWLRNSAGVVMDNAPAHKQLREYLEQNDVTVHDHPPYAPDLNLAEDFIRDLKNKARTDSMPSNNKQLLKALKKAANSSENQKMFLANHENRCENYPRRLRTLIANGGKPCQY